MQPWWLGQDRLVINEPLMLHQNSLLVRETRINHISNLQLKMVGVPHQNGCKLEKSVNHYWVHHLNVIETQSEQKYD